MKRLAALFLVLLLAMAAGGASASSLDPFYALEDYRVDYDQLSGEFFVEHDHRSTLYQPTDSWDVYTTMALYHYNDDGRWISMLQLYFCIDRQVSRIDKVTMLIDGVRYTFVDNVERNAWDDYFGLIVPCGSAMMDMLDAMTTTTGEVRVRYSANTGDIDFVMSDVQIQAIDDLYRAYLGSDFYDEQLLKDIDALYPMMAEDASAPIIGTSETPAPAPADDPAQAPADSGVHLLWDIPLGCTLDEARAIIRDQFGIEMELNDNLDPEAWDDEDYVPVYILMTPEDQRMQLLDRPAEATLYFQLDKCVGAAVQLQDFEGSFASEEPGASAEVRYGHLEEVLALFDQLKAAYGAPASGVLRAHEDVDIASKNWLEIANPPIAYEVNPLTSAGDLDGECMRAALQAHGNFKMEMQYGNLTVSMSCGSMTPNARFSINIDLDFDYPADAPAEQAAASGDASTAGYTEAELAELKTYRTLSAGMRGEDVVRLKDRMYELGYFKNPASSNQYTETTAEYINEFLRANGVTNPDGTITPEQQLLFYSDKAVPKSKATTATATAATTYERIAYKDVARNADLYVGKRWRITTYVVQQIDDPTSARVELILSANRRGDQVIYAIVENFKDAIWTGKVGQVTRLLERDKLEIRAEIIGEYSYETIRGDWLTVPLVNIEEMTLYN